MKLVPLEVGVHSLLVPVGEPISFEPGRPVWCVADHLCEWSLRPVRRYLIASGAGL